MSRVELFKEYPDKQFQLISVNKINCLFPHRYKVTFRDIETNEDYVSEVLPEDLRGTIYLRQYILIKWTY